MPTNRILFFIFVLALIGGLLYINYGAKQHDVETVTLTPKQYIERVQEGRQAPPAAESAAQH